GIRVRDLPRGAGVACAGPAGQGMKRGTTDNSTSMDTLALHSPAPVLQAPTRRSWTLPLLALATLALIALPLAVDSPSHQNLLILILMAAQLGVAWNIVGGYAGQVSLGHVAFF